jgi:hypothetical protein
LATSCFQVNLLEGLQCSETAGCPGDLVCSAASETCVSEEEVGEGGVIPSPGPDGGLAAGADGGGPVIIDPVKPDPGCEPWQTRFFEACANLPEPSGPLVLDGSGTYVLDTETGELTGPGQFFADLSVALIPAPDGGEAALVVHAASISISAKLIAEGERPLILASRGPIALSGRISVAANDDDGGAGADPDLCDEEGEGNDGAGAPGLGGGGGGGGAFAGAGGNGGSALGGIGGSGGTGIGTEISFPRGGCPGGTGATQSLLGYAGEGGDGGGAVHLVSATSIAVSGSLLAGGEGGDGGLLDPALVTQLNFASGGGGGGGSGGFIGIEAPSITLAASARIAANGGAGGGRGGTGDGDGDGANGRDDGIAAVGGYGDPGVIGGDGSSATVLAGKRGVDTELGGGGGGGGAGLIWLITTGSPVIEAGAVISGAQRGPEPP